MCWPSTSASAMSDDLAVAQLGDVEVLADAGAEGGDEAADCVGGQGPVQARLLHVEDLAADRHDRLVLGVAAADGGAAGRVTLDDEDLGVRGALRGAVAQLARHGGGLQDALAAGGLAGLAGGQARGGGLGGLGDDGAGVTGVGVQPVTQLPVDRLLDEGAGLGVAELGLGLALELGLGELDGDDGRQSLADVVTGEVVVALLEQAPVPGVLVDQRRQRRAEALLVGAASVVLIVLA